MNEIERSELLYEALNSAYGIIVNTSDPVKLKNLLYPLRKQDPDLECLSFVTSPTAPDSEIWIVRKPEKTHEQV